jgi:hypothetical protein
MLTLTGAAVPVRDDSPGSTAKTAQLTDVGSNQNDGKAQMTGR